ncbi:hypothetical protein [Streptosporangium carneum]|uniref:Uncharacterized protein n=1 Tax=Streptosporangium carneum TaxID=47481 RepID=A0A9W6I3N1_9ACTN|nr:hypothetical protein [Streptosporangium carneum]GLK10598.1 hypothetical protein GCM10017600_40040 [Streptosporangium carneum]
MTTTKTPPAELPDSVTPPSFPGTTTKTPLAGLPDSVTPPSFPGRWLEGAGLVLGPLLLLAGVLTRVGVDDFFPGQLAAFAADPGRMTLSYSLFSAGLVLLWPAATSLARRIGLSQPGWARWGVTLVVLGLFAKTFHEGANHMAFRMVDAQGLEAASKAVADSYGAFHVFKVLSVAVMFGWIVLAVGAFRSRVFGPGVLGMARSVGLGLASGLPLGVLKGSGDPIALLGIAGLTFALVPLGVSVLREGPAPRWSAATLTVVLIALASFLGMVG